VSWLRPLAQAGERILQGGAAGLSPWPASAFDQAEILADLRVGTTDAAATTGLETNLFAAIRDGQLELQRRDALKLPGARSRDQAGDRGLERAQVSVIRTVFHTSTPGARRGDGHRPNLAAGACPRHPERYIPLRARDERRRGPVVVVACARGACGAFLLRGVLAAIMAPYPDMQ